MENAVHVMTEKIVKGGFSGMLLTQTLKLINYLKESKNWSKVRRDIKF
jgi:hypothetical protein